MSTKEDRIRALELAVETVTKTGPFSRPGTTVLVIAKEYADFLANGALPEDAS